MKNKENQQQMRLSNFCNEFDIPKNTVLLWIHSKDFPAYKIGKCWYIDVLEYYNWRKTEHRQNYKYI